jgi:hypothetical protein
MQSLAEINYAVSLCNHQTPHQKCSLNISVENIYHAGTEKQQQIRHTAATLHIADHTWVVSVVFCVTALAAPSAICIPEPQKSIDYPCGEIPVLFWLLR